MRNSRLGKQKKEYSMGIPDKFLGKHKPKYETLGNIEPVCPYCALFLDKMPSRKTKCPFCANYMYVRTRPADKNRVVVTEQDAAKIDEQWMVEKGIFAHNETADALSSASLDRMKDMGIEGKEWVTAGDDRVCEICLGNEAAGVIPTDKAFPSGHMHPPGCENCRCALAPARLNRKD